MSHFSTAVFSHTPDEINALLAPYNENVDCDSPFAEFEEDEDGDLNEALGKRGYWHNPNARYDYYVWGGRWRGALKLKAGKTGDCAKFEKYEKPWVYPPNVCDRALASDMDFSRDDEAYQKALRRWEVLVEGAPLSDDEQMNGFLRLFKPQYYLNRYGDKEFYADYESRYIPYAFVDADGTWHSCGQIGWFGCDDSTEGSMRQYKTEFNAYLKEAAEAGLIVSMMDLHI